MPWKLASSQIGGKIPWSSKFATREFIYWGKSICIKRQKLSIEASLSNIVQIVFHPQLLSYPIPSHWRAASDVDWILTPVESLFIYIYINWLRKKLETVNLVRITISISLHDREGSWRWGSNSMDQSTISWRRAGWVAADRVPGRPGHPRLFRTDQPAVAAAKEVEGRRAPAPAPPSTWRRTCRPAGCFRPRALEVPVHPSGIHCPCSTTVTTSTTHHSREQWSAYQSIFMENTFSSFSLAHFFDYGSCLM